MFYNRAVRLVHNKLEKAGLLPVPYSDRERLTSVLADRFLYSLDASMKARGITTRRDFDPLYVTARWRDGELIPVLRTSRPLSREVFELLTDSSYTYRTLPAAIDMLELPTWLGIEKTSAPWGDRVLVVKPNESASTVQRRAFAYYMKSEAPGTDFGGPAVYLRMYTERLEMLDVFGIAALQAQAGRLAREYMSLARMAIREGIGAGATPVPTHDTSAAFRAFMEAHQVRDEDATLLALTVPDHGTLSSRTWGIEVESGGARGVNAPDYWDRKYDGSLSSAYGNGECDHDYYSCECEEADDDEDCAEFVSPILRSVHSRGLAEVVGALADNPQNATAGIHVHVGASDLTPKQIGGLVFAYQMIEPMLTPMYRREEREYCKPRPAEDVARVMKSCKTASDQDQISTGDRYHSVNLQSIESHTTIEFRAMGPVYDYEYLIRWAYFVREMVNAAKAEVPVKRWTSVRTFQDVIRIFEEYGQETASGAAAALADTGENRVKLGVSAYQTVGV